MERPGAREVTILAGCEADTLAAGRQLAAQVGSGDLIALSGPLGAGKTVFVRGLAEGLGLDGRQVHSPSFAMVSEYGAPGARLRLVHVDLYRIDDPAEVEDLGPADWLAGGRIAAVEWAEKLPSRLLAGAVRVTIQDAGGSRRRLIVQRPVPPDHSSPSQ